MGGREVPPHFGHERNHEIASVAVATASDARSAAEVAIGMLGHTFAPTGEVVVLLPPPPQPRSLGLAVRVLAGAHPTTVRPRSGLGGLASGADEWREVVLPPAARRFDRGRVPARLLDRHLVLALPLPNGPASQTPIGLLARFAHPRQRLAARIGGDPGAVAELAAPLLPSLVLLAGQRSEREVVVLTRDLIAAELVAEALIAAADDVDAEAPGPWERPAVQRAAELDLGVGTPAGIRLLVGSDEAEDFLMPIRPRIGVS